MTKFVIPIIQPSSGKIAQVTDRLGRIYDENSTFCAIYKIIILHLFRVYEAFTCFVINLRYRMQSVHLRGFSRTGLIYIFHIKRYSWHLRFREI